MLVIVFCPGGNAEVLRDKTVIVLKRVCTRRHCPPCKPRRKHNLSVGLMLNMLDKLHGFAGAAAGDEQLTGKLFKYNLMIAGKAPS